MDRLLREANSSARTIVRKWIQQVFLETATQVLLRNCSVVLEDERRKEGSHNVVPHLTVTEEILEKCNRTCRRLGSLWTMKLIQSDQKEVADWVQEVVEKGCFWEAAETHCGFRGATTGFTDEENDPQEKCQTLQSTLNQPSTGVQEERHHEPSLSITKLRQIGNKGNIKDWIDTLDTMGLQGETMWLNDWCLIQDAAKDIPHRLHLDGGGTKPKIEYEIVPKSILKSPKGEEDDAENDKAAEIVSRTSGHVTFHLERKKRKALEGGEESRASQKTKRHEAPVERAREASKLEAETVWDWERTKMTVEDKGQLEAKYVHPENKPIPNNILLGAIKHLGRMHSFLQNDMTEDESEDTKRTRALARKAVKERLGPLQMIKDERDSNKLLTKMRRAYHNNDQQNWLECDLGECMLEIETKGSNGQKRLFAFSSIELSLKDEDD